MACITVPEYIVRQITAVLSHGRFRENKMCTTLMINFWQLHYDRSNCKTPESGQTEFLFGHFRRFAIGPPVILL